MRRINRFVLVVLVVFGFYQSACAGLSQRVVYHYTAGYLAFFKGDFKNASKHMWAVFPLVKSRDFFNELSDVLIYRGDYYKAARVLRKAISIYKNDKEFYYKLFDVYTILRDKKKAEELMAVIQKRFENQPRTLKGMAFMYIKNGEYEKAYPKLKEYLKLKPNDPAALYYLGEVCLKLKKMECARDALKKAYGLAPNNLRIAFSLASIYEKEHNYKGAVGIYDKLPKTHFIWYFMGNDYYLMGDYKKSFEGFEKAFGLSKRVDYLEKLMFVGIRAGMFDRVRGYCDDFSDLVHESDRLKLFCGIAYRDNCTRAFGYLDKINPKVAFFDEVVYVKIDCLVKQKDWDKLKTLIDSYDKLDYYLYASSALVRHKMCKEALGLLSVALDRFKDQSKRAKLYFYRGDIYYDCLKKRDKAIEDLKSSLRLNPKDARVLNYLGYLYIDEDIDAARGVKLVEKALEIDKDNPYYLDSLGWGYYKLGEYKKAEEFLKRAIELFGHDRESLLISLKHLARVYIKQKEKDKAVETLKKARDISPNDKEVNKLLEELR